MFLKNACPQRELSRFFCLCVCVCVFCVMLTSDECRPFFGNCLVCFRRTVQTSTQIIKNVPWEAFGPPCGPIGAPGLVFRSSQVKRATPFGSHFGVKFGTFFSRSNSPKQRALERGLESRSKHVDFWIPSDPLGRVPAYTPAQFSLFRSGPSWLHVWSHFGIKLEPDISTILFWVSQCGHFGGQKGRSNCGVHFKVFVGHRK